ncbi:hypothetical protein DdX_17775 [Ditylenchus destructor]|uniref:Uncharacterized protein n=1 Tax=Ditylenchus destructor TaxID=166010 RepID=A0AAD4MQQ8_9BILA|nr:hypothetical protein DdX_17775 [Ditylenchus destructor]
MVKIKFVGFLLFCLFASSPANANGEQEVHIKGTLRVPAKYAKSAVAVVKQNGQVHPAKTTCTGEGANKNCEYDITIHAAPGSKYNLGVRIETFFEHMQTLPSEMDSKPFIIEKDFEYVVTDHATSIKLDKTKQGLSKKNKRGKRGR